MLGYGGKKKWEVGNFFSIKLDLEKGAPPYFLETEQLLQMDLLHWKWGWHASAPGQPTDWK